MSFSVCNVPPRSERRIFIAFLIGIISGVLSAFIKSGTEALLPPRTPDRLAPPLKLLEDVGVDWHTLVYYYSDQAVYWAGDGVHIAFSVAAALFYCVFAEFMPAVTKVQGLVFGLVFALLCHGIILPLLGLSPSLAQLPADELISEVLGTCLWAWSIEVVRNGLRARKPGTLSVPEGH